MKTVKKLLPTAATLAATAFGGPLAGMAAGAAVGAATKRKARAPVADTGQDGALQAQKRAANAALEDAALTKAEQAASGRRLRGLGRRALAFQGLETGLAPTLAG